MTRIGLYSDGVTRLVERYGRTWEQLFEVPATAGPRALVEAVRLAERTDPDPTRWRGKPHDDATAVIATITAGSAHRGANVQQHFHQGMLRPPGVRNRSGSTSKRP